MLYHSKFEYRLISRWSIVGTQDALSDTLMSQTDNVMIFLF